MENTATQVIEGNRLIARFMGAGTADVETIVFYKHPASYISTTGHFIASSEDLFYHVRWDWLMPVVEKIVPMRKEFGNCDGRYCIDQMQTYAGRADLKGTWQEVVDFINYFNTQTPTP